MHIKDGSLSERNSRALKKAVHTITVIDWENFSHSLPYLRDSFMLCAETVNGSRKLFDILPYYG